MLSGKVYKVLINLGAWYAGLDDPSVATIKDAFLYMVETLQNEGINCAYMEINTGSATFPAIRFPWADGTLGTNDSPVFMSPVAVATLLPNTASFGIRLGVATPTNYLSESIQVTMWYGSGYNHNFMSTANFTNAVFGFLFDTTNMSDKGFYGIGFAQNSALTSPDTFNTALYHLVTTVKDVESGESVNAMIHDPGNSHQACKMMINGDLVSYVCGLPYANNTSFSNIVQIQKMVFGKYESDFYVSNKNIFTILKEITNQEQIKNHVRINYGGLTIDDVSYDVFIGATAVNGVLMIES